MANEKKKQGDYLPTYTSPAWNNEELQSFYLQDGADDLAGIFGDVEQPVPLFPLSSLHGLPQSYAQDMASPVIKDDTSQFPENGHGYLDEPVSNFSDLVANGSGCCDPLRDSRASPDICANVLDYSHIERNPATPRSVVGGGLQMSKADRKAKADDTCRPWLIKDRIINSGIDESSGHNPNSGQLGINSQISRYGGEASGTCILKPSEIGNQFINASSVPLSSQNPTGEQLRKSNSSMNASAHSNHGQILDGSSLSLNHGNIMDYGSKHSDLSRDNSNSTRSSVPISNTSSCQNIARSSLDSSYNTHTGFSTFQKLGSGFGRLAWGEDNSSPVRNIRSFSNPGQFSSPVQTAGDFSSQTHHIRGSPVLMQNVGGPFTQCRNESAENQFQQVDNQSYDHFTSSKKLGPSPRAKMKVGLNIDPYTSFLDSPPSSSTRHKFSNQVLVQQSPYFEATRLQSFSQPAVGQLQNPYIGVVQEFSPGSSLATTTIARPDFSGNSGQSEASVPVPSGSLSVLPITTGREVAAVDMPKTFIAPSRPFLKRGAPMSPSHAPNSLCKKTRPTKSSCHLSAPTLPQTSPSLAPVVSVAQTAQTYPSISQTVHTGPPIRQIICTPILPQTSPLPIPVVSIDSLNAPIGQTVQTRLPICPTVRTRQPIGPTVRTRPPTGQTVWTHLPRGQTVRTHPPITWTVPTRPHITRTVRTRPPLAHTSLDTPHSPTSSPHVRWQGEDKTPRPSGNQCHICKRDMAFPPEGPIVKSEKPITAAVLPCGHHFHDSCLHRITPPDQAHNPPCIPCAIGENC